MLPHTCAKKVNLSLSRLSLICQILLCHFAYMAHSALQPPYQVALYVTLHPRAPPIHYCNGIIIHSRLILTTASCTYYHLDDDGQPIPPPNISIVPGAVITYNILNNFDVLQISIAPGYNSTTRANNLALLRLNASLPLSQRDDMKWIILDDYYGGDAKAPCMAGFPSLNMDPNSMLLKNVRILPNIQCAPIIQTADLCGRYPYAVGPDCEVFSSDFATYNSDYGTGLIRHSQLVAIFSHNIHTPTTAAKQNCREQSLNAIFTVLGPHLNWIYGVIAQEDLLALNENNLISSAPYQQRENGAIIYVTVTTTESTTKAITTDSATPTPTSNLSSLMASSPPSSSPTLYPSSSTDPNVLLSSIKNGALAISDIKYATMFGCLFSVLFSVSL